MWSIYHGFSNALKWWDFLLVHHCGSHTVSFLLCRMLAARLQIFTSLYSVLHPKHISLLIFTNWIGNKRRARLGDTKGTLWSKSMVETSSWSFIPLLLCLLLEGMKFSEIYIVSGFLLRQVMGNWFFLIEKENPVFLLLENRRFAFLTSNYLFIFYLLLVLSIIISGAILHSHFTGLLSSENHESSQS